MDKVPSTVLIIGGRKFIFPRGVQQSSRVRWWGVVRQGLDILPDGLKLIFVQQQLARKDEAKDIAKRHGVELIEFGAEAEIVPSLEKLLGAEAVAELRAREEEEIEVIPDAADLKLKVDQVVDLPVARIRPFKGQPRVYFNQERLRALAQSIHRAGQKVPVIVVPVEDDPKHDHQIYDGERRWRACQLIHKLTIRAIVAASMDEAEMFKGSAVCNFGREDHQPMEVARALKRIREAEGLSQQELGEIFCRSQMWISQHLALMRLHARVQEMINPEMPAEQQITVQVALEIGKLSIERQGAAADYVLKHKLAIGRVRHYVRKLTDQYGASSGRKRIPYDDWKVLRAFIERTLIRTDEILDLPNWSVKELLHSRSLLERRQVRDNIDLIVEKLEKMKAAVGR